MSNIYEEIYAYTGSIPVINTHSHHREDEFFLNLSFETLIWTSYVGWCGVPFNDTPEGRQHFLNTVRYNSYFIWLEKALKEVYSFDGSIGNHNWQNISDSIKAANACSGFHLELLKSKCNYAKVILDAYWEPGSDNLHPDLFAPAFRINSFLYSYCKESCDHNKNNIMNDYNVDINDIDEYVAFMRKIINQKKKNGCVALKSALAYDRGLDFEETPKDKASKVFKLKSKSSQEDIKAFGDYIFFEICKIAAELDLPLQCHTGMGLLKRSNAMQMREVIEKNPDTKFVLFHGSYPWLEDIFALTHYFRNVYPDLCWLPLISVPAARRMVDELVEISTSEKVCWGCDTWTSEESLGAMMAFRHVLASVMAEKVKDGYFTIEDAEKVTYNMLYHNAKQLYQL